MQHPPRFLKANLLHLSYNMWEEHDAQTDRPRKAAPDLRFDETLWSELLPRMRDAGFNAVVLDLGDGIRYRTHPEIAVRGAWEPQRLVDEAGRLREYGLELIPKLNFSAGHDTWLGPIYSRSVATPVYYQVCSDLIGEVIDLLRPRLFHLGMDEENFPEQQSNNLIVIRRNELFWHDLEFLCREVARRGVTPWVWSDTIWEEYGDLFFERMSREVLQSIWYYGKDFETSARAKGYAQFDAAGFRQIPTCSTCYQPSNPGLTVEHCLRVIDPKRLGGFLSAPWGATLPANRERHFESIEIMAKAWKNLRTEPAPVA
ncbi:MAG TPA: hypothetical protein VNQ90_03905 [Chthoniobacteraceae bacterium]|nr:hypothetical protein [Chthoniobacteraceae bacterium]